MLLTRAPLRAFKQAYQLSVRLACLIHAASVRSEPESNSPLYSFSFLLKLLDQACDFSLACAMTACSCPLPALAVLRLSSHLATTRITTSSSPLLSSLSSPPGEIFLFDRRSLLPEVALELLENLCSIPALPSAGSAPPFHRSSQLPGGAFAFPGSPCRGAAKYTLPTLFRQALFATFFIFFSHKITTH